MANNQTPVKIDEFAAATTVPANSRFLVLQANSSTSNTDVKLVNTSVLFGNVATLTVANLTVTFGSTPANSTITVSRGQIWFDNSYIYVATANNTLKRVALSAF